VAVGGANLTADQVAKANAYQKDAANAQWNPPLSPAERLQITNAANAGAVPAVLNAITNGRFRTAFRAAPNSPGRAGQPLNADNAANNFIIDQFDHDHITAADAVAAYNQNWIYGTEIR
jgi:hypothetical protein